MDYQEWEFFESKIISDGYTIIDHGPLHGPATTFTIKRNRHLDLVLETTSSAESEASIPEPVANAVYQPDGQVHFLERYTGATVTARGVSPGGHESTFSAKALNGTTSGIKIQTSKAHSLHWTSGNTGEASYVMEWIENLSGNFMWPDSDNVEETGLKNRTLQTARGDIVIPLPTTSKQHSRSCAHLSIGSWDVIIGKSRAKPEHVKNPGFILYFGLPDEDTRSRIRKCLSFCLGDYFVYLGCTTFNAEWIPVSFLAMSAHALSEDADNISGRPPAPLGERYEWQIDAALLSRMASGLFAVYDKYNLTNAFWNYWHAAAAPVHMAAAHFGAAIEALQKAYFDNIGAAHNRIVDDKEAWNAIYAQIARCIQDSALLPEQKRILCNKAQNLNSAPQSLQADKFFAAIGLGVSKLEQDVWKNRNSAAHGGGITETRAIPAIRENTVLMMLMNRILLSISGASGSYYDYYTLNRPCRQLSEPVPDDRLSATH